MAPKGQDNKLSHVWPRLTSTKVWDASPGGPEDLGEAWIRLFGTQFPKKPIHIYRTADAILELYPARRIVQRGDNGSISILALATPSPSKGSDKSTGTKK